MILKKYTSTDYLELVETIATLKSISTGGLFPSEGLGQFPLEGRQSFSTGGLPGQAPG